MLEAIKDIINPDAMMCYDEHKRSLIVKEKGNNSKIRKLFINNMPNDFLAFTLDHQPSRDGGKRRCFQQLSPYVNFQNNKINKNADLIVLYQQTNSNNVLIVELKSDKLKRKPTQTQLDNTRLYVNYLLSMVNYYYKIDTSDIAYKQVIVTTNCRNVGKGMTYKPNNDKNQDGYYVKSVSPDARKEAKITFPQLAQQHFAAALQ